MESRLGVCSSCQAQFKIPATFTAARAKCKNCGGVVEIGEAKSAKPSAPAAQQAKQPAAPALAKPAPAGAKAPAVPAVKPPALASAASSAKSPPRAPSAPAPARASAPVSATRPKPAAPHASAPKSSAKVEAVEPSAKGTSERVNKAALEATARLRSGEARQSARARSTRAAPKKNNLALIGGIAAVVLAAGGFGFWKWKGSSSEPSSEPGAILAADKGSNPAEPAQPEAAPSAQPAAAGSQAAQTDAAAKAPADSTTPPKEGAAGAAKPEKKPKAEAVAGDPNSINLAAYPDQAPLEETSPERAEELKTLAANLVDTDNPRAGTKAKPQLVEAGKEAIPFLLNQFKAQDVSVELGMRNADLIQRTLTEICRGYNFGWKYTLEPKDVYFNKKAIEAWIKAFDKARVDPEFWAKMSKQGQVEREKAESEAELKADAASEEKREDF